MTPPADPARYKNHRFPGEIISHGVWLYYRFPLSYRDVQELLFERGIDVTHEAIRQWCLKFGQDYAHQLKRRRAQPGDKWHLDEVFLTINGQRLADITRAEVTSALARRAREGVITLDERDELIQAFRAHCATQYRIVPTQPGIIDLATALLQRHPLRAYDAVQLASASIVNQSLIAHGLPPLIFVTADDRFIAATRDEAVTAENPNLYP